MVADPWYAGARVWRVRTTSGSKTGKHGGSDFVRLVHCGHPSDQAVAGLWIHL